MKKDWSDVSSNVIYTDYKTPSQTMVVKFKSGKIYYYFGVPKDLYLNMLQTTSVGKFLNEFIVKEYSYEQVN